MVDIFSATVLGVVQGITEWLPISSSGHLAISQKVFGLGGGVALDVALHMATLVVLFLVFYRDIINILKAIYRRDFGSRDGKLALFIIIGSIPTGIIGFVFHDMFASFFENMLVVGIALLLTGIVLFMSRIGVKEGSLGYKNSILIGIVQGISIIPGMSRSGLTIGTGLLSGVNREDIIRFSFLLSIPAVIGAALYEAPSIVSIDLMPLFVGMLVSILVGYLSLRAVIGIVRQGRFHLFSLYCWAMGITVLYLALSGLI